MEKETDYKGLFRLFTRSIVISTLGMIFPFLYILFPSMYVAESVKEGIIKVMATLLAVVLLLGAFMGPVQAIVVLYNLWSLHLNFSLHDNYEKICLHDYLGDIFNIFYINNGFILCLWDQ